jgi:mannose-6-phosphate isomerase
LINELDADLRPRDRRLRLWPQTERIKALILLREGERDEDRRNELAGRIAAAVEALLGYFQHPVAGAWWEHFDAAGQPIVEPARASSLYHIMGAANELARVTRVRLD